MIQLLIVIVKSLFLQLFFFSFLFSLFFSFSRYATSPSVFPHGVSSGTIILNSTLHGNGIIGTKAVVLNCSFGGDGWSVGSGSVVVGLHDTAPRLDVVCVPENCVVQEVFLRSHSQTATRNKKNSSVVGADESNGDSQAFGEGSSVDDVKNAVRSVVLLYGLEDEWRKEFEEEGATYCGEPWSCLFARTGLEVKK